MQDLQSVEEEPYEPTNAYAEPDAQQKPEDQLRLAHAFPTSPGCSSPAAT